MSSRLPPPPEIVSLSLIQVLQNLSSRLPPPPPTHSYVTCSWFFFLNLDPFLWINFRMVSVSNLPHGENTLDDLFECFIDTLYSTFTAIAFDIDANQKLEFKAYLFTAIVPITTVATGLGYTQKIQISPLAAQMTSVTKL